MPLQKQCWVNMKVLIADKAAKEGIDKIKAAGFEVDVKTGLNEDQLIEIIADYAGMMVRSETKVTAKIIDAAKNMKIIGRAGVGVDNIDVVAATKKGIVVVNSPNIIIINCVCIAKLVSFF